MNREQIIAAIEDEINRLEQVRKLLKSATGQRLVSSGVAIRTPKKRILSPEARQRIAAAQKRRWAKQKAAVSNAKK
jgi:hypothetical protein